MNTSEHTIKGTELSTEDIDRRRPHLLHRIAMKKMRQSPWYGLIWIAVWTVALIWFVVSGMFDTREILGFAFVWLVMVGMTMYLLWKRYQVGRRVAQRNRAVAAAAPALNAPCPCGSGKKYKRCCGA
ncbi:MAG: SEC-C domain-containing protein [Desulfomonile sp.]|nr:SEC-C domain-containing protein [Desulfomonile sp.]